MAKKRRVSRSKNGVTSQSKVTMVTRKFAFFLLLTLISFVLYKIISNSLLVNFFGLLAMVFGFLSLAFLILLILLSLLRMGKK